MGRLDDKIAVVTGASRGLGEGIARRLADEGAVVVCADVLDASEVAASLPGVAVGRQTDRRAPRRDRHRRGRRP